MLTLIDAHVHVHAAADAPGLLQSAASNFARAAQQLRRSRWTGVLVMAEMKQARWFESMAAGGGTLPGGWTLHPDPHDDLVLRARHRDQELLVIAGRQVATREGIEVLTLATRAHCPDGLPLAETLQRAHQAQAVSVLPWGAGKWLGRRGELVRAALLRQSPPVWAGDSAARPGMWPAEAEFGPALSQGRPLINGTDPLPLQGEVQRAGSFGSWLAESPPAERPGQWLRERLRSATPAELRPFGAPMRLARFVRSQVALRLRKPRPKRIASIAGEGPHAADVETSSAAYASRFAGASGRYLLGVQSRCIAEALADLPPGRALDVGGGHGQLVDVLRGLGWQVTVHGTHELCERNLRELHGQRDCAFVRGDLFNLPAPDRSFELVIAVRLVSHVEQWPKLLAEMCRVASRSVVIDYPTRGGTNARSGRFFGLKKAVEGNTRNYLSFSHEELRRVFAAHGFKVVRSVKQFVLPMVAHRIGRGAAPLRWIESASRALGLTAWRGSPVILRVDRR